MLEPQTVAALPKVGAAVVQDNGAGAHGLAREETGQLRGRALRAALSTSGIDPALAAASSAFARDTVDPRVNAVGDEESFSFRPEDLTLLAPVNPGLDIASLAPARRQASPPSIPDNKDVPGPPAASPTPTGSKPPEESKPSSPSSSAAPTDKPSPSSSGTDRPSGTSSAPSSTKSSASNAPSPTDSKDPKAKPTSTASATPSKAPDDKSATADDAPLFDRRNRFFPLAVVGCVAAALLGLFFLVFLGRTIAHHDMERQALEVLKNGGGKGGVGDDEEKYTQKPTRAKRGGLLQYGADDGGGGGGFVRRSLRRALTRGSSSSFARRHREGTVLIDVGDEVFAVTPAVAEEYERCRSLAHSRLHSGASSSNGGGSGSGGGSTALGFNPKKALRDAEARALAESHRRQQRSENDPFKRRASQPEVVDIASWRVALAQQGQKPPPPPPAPPLDGASTDGGMVRSLSQRLVRGIKALRGLDADSVDRAAQDEEARPVVPVQRHTAANNVQPVISRGEGGWSIAPVGEQKGEGLAQLSHPRVTLTDEPVANIKTTAPGGRAGTTREPRRSSHGANAASGRSRAHTAKAAHGRPAKPTQSVPPPNKPSGAVLPGGSFARNEPEVPRRGKSFHPLPMPPSIGSLTAELAK